MFGIGTGELMIVALVALIVLGPERLPKAARFAGLWVRRARHQWNSVKQELERELQADEIKRNLEQMRQGVRDTETSLRAAGEAMHREGDRLRREVDAVDAPGGRDAAGHEVPATTTSLLPGADVLPPAAPAADAAAAGDPAGTGTAPAPATEPAVIQESAPAAVPAQRAASLPTADLEDEDSHEASPADPSKRADATVPPEPRP